jgi:drug/metabolite transporter (DMT)-like permease
LRLERLLGARVQEPIWIALASAALFGFATPLAKLLLADVPPLMVAALLYLGSGIGLTLYRGLRLLVADGAAAAIVPVGREKIWLGAAIVLGGVAGPIALFYGLSASTASSASLLLNLESAFTAILAWVFFREHFDRKIVAGMCAMVAGGAVLAFAGAGPGGTAPGAALIALACLCWALDNNCTSRVTSIDAVTIAALKGISAGAVNLSLALLAGIALPAPERVGGAFALGLFGYGLSLVLFVLALRGLGAARAGAYFSVAPFFGAALAVAMFGEPVTWQLIAAAVMMAGGLWLLVTERHEHVHRHPAQAHSHFHGHDEHHDHEHDFPWDAGQAHSHGHFHRPLVHDHAHAPDIHHRHPHEHQAS